MTLHELPEQFRDTQPAALLLRDHHKDLRDKAIRKYLNATFWTTRREARADTLHHAKLVRMLEGRG